MSIIKHVGKISNTDQRVIVAFMQIPGDPNYALVIPTDNLPDRLQQAVRDICESQQGQNELNLADLLGRRLFEDSGQNVLQLLHERGYLQKMPIDNVTMYPLPNQPYPLRDLLGNLAKMGLVAPVSRHGAPDELPTERFNPHAQNQQVTKTEEATGAARQLLIQAQILREEAQLKEEQAYALQPSLRPNSAPAANYVVPAAAAELTVEADTKVKRTAKAKAPAKAPTRRARTAKAS